MLIDGNSIGWAAYHGQDKKLADGMEVQAVYGFLMKIRQLRERFPKYSPVVLWDAGSWRHAMSITYKDNRKSATSKQKDMRESYGLQMKHIRDLLSRLNVRQCMAEGFEADDLAGYYVYKASLLEGDRSVLLVTGDRDWLQLLGPFSDVAWHDPRRFPGLWIDSTNFEEMTGFRDGFEFLSGKALIGDVSDNIKGVKGFGPACAKAFMAEYGSVAHFISNGPDAPIPDSLKRFKKPMMRLITNEDGQRTKFYENLNLMSLRGTGMHSAIRAKLKVIPSAKSMSEFIAGCEHLELYSIVRNSEKWEIF